MHELQGESANREAQFGKFREQDKEDTRVLAIVLDSKQQELELVSLS